METTWALLQLSYFKGLQWIQGPAQRTSIPRHKTYVPIFDQLYSFLFEPPTLITDNIYLGNAFHASCQSVLNHHNIGAILNVSGEIPCFFPQEYTYLWLNVNDDTQATLQPYFDQAYTFIREQQTLHPDKRILIHCYMGASRSASIMAYYLMRKLAFTRDAAVSYLEDKRPVVNINQAFLTQLAQLEIGAIPEQQIMSPSHIPSR